MTLHKGRKYIVIDTFGHHFQKGSVVIFIRKAKEYRGKTLVRTYADYIFEGAGLQQYLRKDQVAPYGKAAKVLYGK